MRRWISHRCEVFVGTYCNREGCSTSNLWWFCLTLPLHGRTRMAGHFRSFVWDPVLLISQIATMQCFFYVGLGLMNVIVDLISGHTKSLDELFSYNVLQFKQFPGRLIMGAYLLNALVGALGLWYIIKRTKQCLDFTVTVHLFHLIACWIYNGYFPNTVSWWLVNLICILIMTVVGEFLCMRTEMKAIPLSMATKADL